MRQPHLNPFFLKMLYIKEGENIKMYSLYQ